MASAIRSMSVASIPNPMMLDIVNSLPEPNEAFVWVQADSKPRLQCRDLQGIARHFFTTRGWRLGSTLQGAESDAWEEIAQAAEIDGRQLARVHQVHGASVVRGEDALRQN